MLKIRKHKPWTPWIELNGSPENIKEDDKLSKDAKFTLMIMGFMREMEPRACLSPESIRYFLKHNEGFIDSTTTMFNNAKLKGHSNQEIKQAILSEDRSFFDKPALKLIDPVG